MGIEVTGGEPKGLDLTEDKYHGKIRLVEKAENGGYMWFNMYVAITGKEDTELKAGFPFPKADDGLNPKSLLGKAIEAFTGEKVEVDKKYDLQSIFEGKTCSFFVKKKGQYWDLDRESLKPSEGGA